MGEIFCVLSHSYTLCTLENSNNYIQSKKLYSNFYQKYILGSCILELSREIFVYTEIEKTYEQIIICLSDTSSFLDGGDFSYFMLCFVYIQIDFGSSNDQTKI